MLILEPIVFRLDRGTMERTSYVARVVVGTQGSSAESLYAVTCNDTLTIVHCRRCAGETHHSSSWHKVVYLIEYLRLAAGYTVDYGSILIVNALCILCLFAQSQ